MQSQLGHLQINIKRENLLFYKELLAFLEWQVVYSTDDFIGAADKNGASVWFMGFANDAQNDYDGVGMNHLAFGVAQQRDVDAAVAYYRALRPRLRHLDAWRRSRSLAFQPLRVPALVLAGERDGCIGAELFAHAATTDDAPLDCRILPSVGHFMHLEDPARVHALILERLAASR